MATGWPTWSLLSCLLATCDIWKHSLAVVSVFHVELEISAFEDQLSDRVAEVRAGHIRTDSAAHRTLPSMGHLLLPVLGVAVDAVSLPPGLLKSSVSLP